MPSLVRGCPLCGDQALHPAWSGIARLYGQEILARSFLVIDRDLYLTPGPGTLAPGYVILAPRDHCLSSADLSADVLQSAENLTRAVERTMAELGPYAVFEHGGASAAARGAACVTHAHLHIAPTPAPETLHHELEGRFRAREVDRLSDLAHAAGSEPYLLLRTTAKTALYSGAPMESQLLRKLIAKRLGVTQEWNWREFPRAAAYRATLTAYGDRLDEFRNAVASEP